MSSQGAGLGSEVLEVPVCQHQWLIDSPAGPSSSGTCRLCGEEKEFPNYIEDTSWGYDISLEQLAGGSRVSVTKDRRKDKELDED